MFGKFQENMHSADIKQTEIKGPNHQEELENLSIDNLKSKLEEIFTFKLQECQVTSTDIHAEDILEGKEFEIVVLEDGTVIELPKPEQQHISVIDVSDSGELLPNSKYEIEGKTFETDDNGKIYLVDEKFTQNNTFELNESTYKADDNGYLYMVDGKLEPNATYELNGNVYKTDNNGRIVSCEAKPVRSPENPRDNDAQKEAGGKDRKENDQGGHIVGRDLNGDGGDGNLLAMDSRINQSDYKRMENDVKSALDESKDVTTKTEITYTDESERPDKIKVTVVVEGKETVYIFDNNLDGSLINEVDGVGKQNVQEELKDTGGQISSIKKEYNENGELVNTTVSITYIDGDGNNRRTKVVISNIPGGEN